MAVRLYPALHRQFHKYGDVIKRPQGAGCMFFASKFSAVLSLLRIDGFPELYKIGSGVIQIVVLMVSDDQIVYKGLLAVGKEEQVLVGKIGFYNVVRTQGQSDSAVNTF